MDDITTRLRRTRANMLGTEDEDHYYDCHEAAGEIERLRQWGRLTDAERSAIADAADRYAALTPESADTVATLRGLLERLGGGEDH